MTYFISSDEVIAVPDESLRHYEMTSPDHITRTTAESALSEVHLLGFEWVELRDITEIKPHGTLYL